MVFIEKGDQYKVCMKYHLTHRAHVCDDLIEDTPRIISCFVHQLHLPHLGEEKRFRGFQTQHLLGYLFEYRLERIAPGRKYKK